MMRDGIPVLMPSTGRPAHSSSNAASSIAISMELALVWI
jgi:hypothetical protein